MIEMLYPYWKVPPMAAQQTVRARVRLQGFREAAGSASPLELISAFNVPALIALCALQLVVFDLKSFHNYHKVYFGLICQPCNIS
ncbi:unnamed protein product [Tetraodon nigroviridis]|uniref:(spotted green pufferfish) hypothetical protein n=1 Tax=Tetraodon nigroviridis TaxID=99883 RepID=Q4SQT4_TETNG|nr:unnamed protein product [Tetraodon nigroviridis]